PLPGGGQTPPVTSQIILVIRWARTALSSVRNSVVQNWMCTTCAIRGGLFYSMERSDLGHLHRDPLRVPLLKKHWPISWLASLLPATEESQRAILAATTM